MVAASVHLMEPDQDTADDAGHGVVPQPVVVKTLARIGNDVALLQSAPTLCLSDAELRTAVEQTARMRARLEAGYLHLLASLDSRPDGVPGAATGSAGATFLVHAVTMSPGQAHLDVKVAHALDADGAGITPENAAMADLRGTGLPRVGAALAAGEISRAHANVAYRCLDRIPQHLLTDVGEDGLSGAARVDEFLADHSRRLAPTTTRGLAKQLLALLDPDGSDRYDPDAFTRRRLCYGADSTGMLTGDFALDPAAAATFRAALEAYTKRQFGSLSGAGGEPDGITPDGQPTLPLRDERTPAQRRADALHQLCLDAIHGTPGRTLRDDGVEQRSEHRGPHHPGERRRDARTARRRPGSATRRAGCRRTVRSARPRNLRPAVVRRRAVPDPARPARCGAGPWARPPLRHRGAEPRVDRS